MVLLLLLLLLVIIMLLYATRAIRSRVQLYNLVLMRPLSKVSQRIRRSCRGLVRRIRVMHSYRRRM